MKITNKIAIVLGLTAQCAMADDGPMAPKKDYGNAPTVDSTPIPFDLDGVYEPQLGDAPTKPTRPAHESIIFVPGEGVVTSLF